MCEKVVKEWNLDVPWGKLAMVSWGDPGRPPVLLVHGYSDTAATFRPLVALLPDTYYYVAFDLPGHGRSQLAPGPPVSYLHFVDCIRVVAERLQWPTFTCIAHSLGYIICCCYNAAFPGRMTKLVNLDGSIFIGWHYMTDHHEIWFQHSYDSCYRKYFASAKPVTYAYEEAISLLMQSRSVYAETAASLAARCLAPTIDGAFRFTWDRRVKKISTALFSSGQLLAILASNLPTLNIVTSQDVTVDMFKEYTREVVTILQRETKNYHVLKVEGTHDVHLNNPKSIVDSIVEFLERDFGMQSKL